MKTEIIMARTKATTSVEQPTNENTNTFDAHKFSTVELFSNSNGKTSSTKWVGLTSSMVCLVLFISLTIYYFIFPAECGNILEFIDRVITFFSVSAGLMGIKSISSSIGSRGKVEIKNTPEKKGNDE